MHELNVDLNAPPEQRWGILAAWRKEARELLAFYVRDIGGIEPFAPLLMSYCNDFVEPEYAAELRGVARVLDAPIEEVVLANLYYDAIKLVLHGGIGCTAFAIDTPSSPLHARNLDWQSGDGQLAANTVIVNFRRGDGPPVYRTVGWPGFVGCLSGTAPGRFAVTLNAVLSDDPPELAPPISFVLRRVLETAETFDDAVTQLRDTAVASDSLLLVTGTRAGQMAVVERAPTRAAVRGPTNGALLVTNDYRALSASPMAVPTPLSLTSSGRYGRAEELLRQAPPQDSGACLGILRDAQVKMGITVQHMVLSAADGTITVELPS